MITIKEHETPDPSWTRGFPPRSPEKQQQIRDRLTKLHGGKPKSLEQREKMRQRKLGIPKSDSHKQTMSKSQRERLPRIQAIRQMFPDLTYQQASSLEARLRKNPIQPEWYRKLLDELE
jgi:hypothetical protein